MTTSSGLGMFQRKPLDQITQIPDSIISVYVVENHIWADGGSQEARVARKAELRTVEEFLIDPVRAFLNDICRLMAAPYTPQRKDNPIGQGYWIQAEFGSGKSHLLSFLGALALGMDEVWDVIKEKDRKAGLGRRESLYNFYENGLEKKGKESKGIFVAVKTLVGQGGGAIGLADTNRSLTDYVLDAVSEQFYQETGRSLPLYPTEILAERFLSTDDFERYRKDLAKYLRDAKYFDEEEQEDISEFLDDLQNNPDPGVQRDCGQRLWDFYERYLKTRPQIPMEAEAVLKHMVERLLAEGYAGLLLILDEVSLFMRSRSDTQRYEDEKALVVLSNRLAKMENLPVWTVCAAQQAIESKMAGVRNILARERLDLVPLLGDAKSYYDIALSRVREITDTAAIDQYYEDYKRSFSWPEAVGRDEFARFFPFYPPSIDIVRAVSMNLTTVRSALYFMLETLKTQRKRGSRELITHWSLFDDVVEYSEDPSGTHRSIASIKTKWPDRWQSYEAAKRQIDSVINGPLKVYRSRCEKMVKTLFLYQVADIAPNGLGHEELMNAVMEWKDHDKGQKADLQDNLDHYESLADKVALELAQVVRVGRNYRFNPTGGGTDPREHFQKARSEAEQNEIERRRAWEALLALKDWKITAQLATLDLSHDVESVFRDIAPASQQDITIKWHGREIGGRVLMRDLLDIGKRDAMLPSVNSADTGLDFMVFISSTPATSELDSLVKSKGDPRVLFWSPDALTPMEASLLVDFTAYRSLVRDFSARDTQEAKEVMGWVQSRLRAEMGSIYRIVPDSYGRGRMTAQDHSQMDFTCQGELPAILTPLVGQVLDATYECKDMEFDAPAPFNDLNAVNVINGIVKVGEIPRGAKPNRDISAAQNYGFALQIMRRPNDRKLDLSECRYCRDIAAWIEEKLGESGGAMPVATVYKNFMGIGGPTGSNYGLSRRMVQLYLLALARDGKLRISLAGSKAPVEAIDYSNIAGIDFKMAVLDAMNQVQRVKPPEGWQLLAPFAAALLDDPALKELQDEGDIQEAVQRVIDHKAKQLPGFRTLSAGLSDLFGHVGQPNPREDALTAWEKFLASPDDRSDPISYLLHGLDKAFDYRVYAEGVVRQDDVDDFQARQDEIALAETFYQYRDRLLAAVRYTDLDLPDDPSLADIDKNVQHARGVLARLGDLMENETRLLGELLDPMGDAMESYRVRYLQAFDTVTGHSEEVRQEIAALPRQPAYLALGRLAQVKSLGADPRPALGDVFRGAIADSPGLFPCQLTRSVVERELHERPHPPGCPMTLANAGEWMERADAALTSCREALNTALREKAALLHSQALRDRLGQGREEPFIAGLLKAEDVNALAAYLTQTLGQDRPGESDAVGLLTRYLKKLQVRKLRMADFRPGKRTIEAADVDGIVAEFRAFLLSKLSAGDEDELPIVELE